jgi:hypothetical protein
LRSEPRKKPPPKSLIDLPSINRLPGEFKIGVEDEIGIAEKDHSPPAKGPKGSHRQIIFPTDQMVSRIASDGPSRIEKHLGVIFHGIGAIERVDTSHGLRLGLRNADWHGKLPGIKPELSEKGPDSGTAIGTHQGNKGSPCLKEFSHCCLLVGRERSLGGYGKQNTSP